jgi:hypothetical protein
MARICHKERRFFWASKARQKLSLFLVLFVDCFSPAQLARRKRGIQMAWMVIYGLICVGCLIAFDVLLPVRSWV